MSCFSKKQMQGKQLRIYLAILYFLYNRSLYKKCTLMHTHSPMQSHFTSSRSNLSRSKNIIIQSSTEPGSTSSSTSISIPLTLGVGAPMSGVEIDNSRSLANPAAAGVDEAAPATGVAPAGVAPSGVTPSGVAG